MRKRSAFGTEETGKAERVVGQLDDGGADMPATYDGEEAHLELWPTGAADHKNGRYNADFLNAGSSVVQVEVQHVPVGDEREESDTPHSQANVPNTIPKPLLFIAPRNKGIENGDERAETGENPGDLQEMNPEIAALAEAAGFLESLQRDEQAGHEGDIEEANDANDQAKALGARIEREGLGIVATQNSGHRPKEDGEDDDSDTEADDDVVEDVLLEGALDFLEEHKRIIDVGKRLAVGILHEGDFVLAVNFLEEHGSDFLEVLGLAVRELEGFRNENGVVLRVGDDF